ncbi:MAG TPA: tetratricopeptide repeat-containing glycosyltransferase family protein [Bradyrhizobium sp.]|nr:tetratricopeptide repeat-containing glycosyltransferase family protein [Bradyrhizobium sp.]
MSQPASPAEETPAAWFEAGFARLQAGQLAEAEQCVRSALALDPRHADSLHLMGLLCFAARQYDLAIEWFVRAIRQNPDAADYVSNLGMALQRTQRFDEAIRSFDRALVLKGDQAETWFRMGECLQQQKRNPEAIMSFEKALTIDPKHAGAAGGSAMLHLEEGRYEQAIASFDRLLQVRTNLAGAFKLKSFCLAQLDRLEEALAASRKAIELAPDDVGILDNAGLVLQRLGRHDEALVCFDQAIARDPAFANPLFNRARSLLAMLRLDEAVAALDAVIAIAPNHAKALWNKALTQLQLGNFADGWALRERVRTIGGILVDRNFTQPQWRGEGPIAGRTILLHGDEGLGDTIQYVRYVKKVAQLGARVILQVDDPVQPLVSAIEGVAQCLPRSAAELPDFDIHCPLSALPFAFETRLATVPSEVPYLPAPPEALRQAWEERLGSHDKMRIGLVWSGSQAHGDDRQRSMQLRTMCRLLDVDARFFSLQKEPRPGDRLTLLERPDILDFTGHLADFAETAAMLSCLDLVITVDTSVAHLAGALARPTWIMLAYAPDYRWLLDRDDSPWYPTVRLFRQTATRDYGEVLDRVRGELKAHIAALSPAAVRPPPRR